jgi:hypothetical protein
MRESQIWARALLPSAAVARVLPVWAQRLDLPVWLPLEEQRGVLLPGEPPEVQLLLSAG